LIVTGGDSNLSVGQRQLVCLGNRGGRIFSKAINMNKEEKIHLTGVFGNMITENHRQLGLQGAVQ